MYMQEEEELPTFKDEIGMDISAGVYIDSDARLEEVSYQIFYGNWSVQERKQLEEEIVQSVLDESVLNLPRQERYMGHSM